MIRQLSVPLLFVGLVPACAAAQTAVQRTFVSTTGDDTNTASSCSPALPCRSFAAAMTVTKPGGEIVPLTSGGYGSVTITQSVQIAAPFGVYAAITAASGNAITVNAAATDTVVLKGLAINGLGTGNRGISATSFKALYVENCVVSGFAGIGVIADYSTGASPGSVSIKDTIVRNNADTGLYFRATYASTQMPISIDTTRSEGNGQHGLLVTNSAKATISRTVTSFNGNSGFYVLNDTFLFKAEINCDGCVASNNGNAGFAVFATTPGTVTTMRVARSSATDNVSGFSQTLSLSGNSTFESLSGTNLVRGNTTNTIGTITPVTSP